MRKLLRNEDGEPIVNVPNDNDCGLDKEFYAHNQHLLENDDNDFFKEEDL